MGDAFEEKIQRSLADLQKQGAKIRAYDPHAMDRAKSILKNVAYARDAYDACRGADCLLILTEWDEFKRIDLKRIKKLLHEPTIIDGRNLFEPKMMKEMGFRYSSIGRA